MPVYTVPPNSGPFVVVRGKDGEYAVADQHAATDKTALFIPCRDEPQAIAVRDQLNAGDHDGTVRVDLLAMPEAKRDAQ